MADLEKRARDLLAAEFDKEGYRYAAQFVRDGSYDKCDVDIAVRVIAAALSSQAQAPEEVHAIGRLIATQNNRITEAPIFIVQQKRVHVSNPDYDHDRIAWVNADGEASAEEAKALDTQYASSGQEPDGWRRVAVGHTWEFVTACFTEQGCKNYIACNGHNLCEPRIYAAGSFRNREWHTVRSFLIAAAAAPDSAGNHG